MMIWIRRLLLVLALVAFYLYLKPAEQSEQAGQSEEIEQSGQKKLAQPLPQEKAETQEPTEQPQQPQHQPKRQISFTLPLACTLGENCWVARYSDRAAGRAKADYRCGRRTQDGHKGTDFAVANIGEMKRGVAVLAAAGGTVLRTRDTMPDISVLKTGRKKVKNKECGNAAIVEHTGGYTTQYCHMRRGSVTVKPGDKIKQGDKIGLLGLSGDTEYPHMHLNVRKDGKRIDPFDGQRLNTACGEEQPRAGLWAEAPLYTGMDLMPLVFSAAPLTRETRWDEQPASFAKDVPALILSGIAWNVMVGDTWHFNIFRPDGTQATNQRLTAKKNRQSQWYANRMFQPKDGFMPGVWRGRLTVSRQNTDGTISYFERSAEVLVTD